MNPILFVGPYRDFSGWSQASEDYILALDACGVSVVPRCARFTFNNNYVHSRILELEQKSPTKCDIVLQQVLPSVMEYNGHFKKNIGLYCSESSNINLSSWVEKLNLMDEIFVPSNQMKECALNSHITKPIKVIPYTCSAEKYGKSYKKRQLSEGNFVFYTIGAVNKRKNLSALIKAFHLEFEPYESVSLLIKASQSNISSDECRLELTKYCDDIKIGLNLHTKLDFYKKEILITEELTQEEIGEIHYNADCGVFPSYGEAWGIPTFDSMAFGKTPIVTNWGAFPDYIDNSVGWLVDYQLEPVFGMNNIDNIYSGKSEWANISISHLRKNMREAYENNELRGQKAMAGIDRAWEFDYSVIGERLKEALY